MAIDLTKNQLIELYKTTRGEFHHHNATYIQACIGLAIIIPVFLTAISLLFDKDFPLRSEYLYSTKWVIFVLVIILVAFFAVGIYRISGRVTTCKEVSRRIENRLIGIENTEQGHTLERLLIGKELDKNKFDNWFGNHRFYFYIPLGLLAFVALGFLLFKCIVL